ncbi:helix-turn-helix domain-containing protein [Chromobacterium haemolyticum]|uniref:helix-turn-helix domain-containing protein n=1 Tax=Chromobacterium haemolyticum TaxID=394935 RepID=UPI000594DA9C|nr:helix-turn-helix domain-containing protein [Chromobacterium haemolyticum]
MESVYDRLLNAAQELRPNDVTGARSLADFLGESPQTISNWKTRGVPRAKITTLAARVHVTSEWLETGHGLKRPATEIDSDGKLISGDVTPLELIEEAAKRSGMSVAEMLADYIIHQKKKGG